MDRERKIRLAAKIAHEVNRAYCCAALNDASQPKWSDAPFWQQDSAIDGVRSIIMNRDWTPKQQHERWMQLKERDGWKYGPVKDVDKKEHPCMKPYEELPPEQQVKDHLFGAVVRAFFPGVKNDRTESSCGNS